MKQIIILCLIFAPCMSFAAEPSTSCPENYVSVIEDYMTIARDACPSALWFTTVIKFRAIGADNIYTLNSTLYSCHAMRDKNITLCAALRAHTRE